MISAKQHSDWFLVVDLSADDLAVPWTDDAGIRSRTAGRLWPPA